MENEEIKERMALKFMKENPGHHYSIQFLQEGKKLNKGQLKVLCAKVRRQIRLERKEKMLLISHELWLAKRQAKKDSFEKRVLKVFELLKTKTLNEAGIIMGITRERVRQILKEGVKRGVVEEYKRHLHPSTRPLREVTCACGKVFATRRPNVKYCSSNCFRSYRPKGMTSEQVKEHRLWRYHNDPEYRAKHIKAVLNYYNKIKHTPRYIKRQKIYSARWREKQLKKISNSIG